MCSHNIRKSLCIECHGISLCIHRIRKARCKECKGGSICEHKKRKDCCPECKKLKILNKNHELDFNQYEFLDNLNDFIF